MYTLYMPPDYYNTSKYADVNIKLWVYFRNKQIILYNSINYDIIVTELKHNKPQLFCCT